jgi:hypothetical protein
MARQQFNDTSTTFTPDARLCIQLPTGTICAGFFIALQFGSTHAQYPGSPRYIRCIRLGSRGGISDNDLPSDLASAASSQQARRSFLTGICISQLAPYFLSNCPSSVALRGSDFPNRYIARVGFQGMIEPLGMWFCPFISFLRSTINCSTAYRFVCFQTDPLPERLGTA